MLSKDKKGIICDRCAMGVTAKFTYYSFDAQEVNVNNNSMVIAQATNPMTPGWSFDICQRCMEEIKAIIIKCYKPSRIIDNRSCPNGITCDLTGIRMNRDFVCYYIVVSIVNVDLNAKPSTKVVDDKYLELWVCKEAFEQLRSKALEIKNNKENKEWSAQSILTQ
jgi:hypothetical protein